MVLAAVVRTDLRGWKQGDQLNSRAEAVVLLSIESSFTSKSICRQLSYILTTSCLSVWEQWRSTRELCLELTQQEWGRELVHKASCFSQWDKFRKIFQRAPSRTQLPCPRAESHTLMMFHLLSLFHSPSTHQAFQEHCLRGGFWKNPN